MKSFHFLCFVCIIFQFGASLAKDPKLQVCTNPKPNGVNQDVLKKIGEHGFFIPMHMKLDSMMNKSSPPAGEELPMKDATTGEPLKAKSEKCYELVIRLNYGKLFIPLKCKYYDGMKIRCTARMTTPNIPGNAPLPIPGPAAALPRPDGSFFHSKTDNSTYSVVVGCMGASQPIWLVLAGEAEIKNPKKKSEILDHIKSLGFDPGAVASISDPLLFQRLDHDDCNNDMTNLSGNPTGALLGSVQKQASHTGSADGDSGANSGFLA